MSQQEPVQTAIQPRPAPFHYTTWNEYWTTERNQPWRAEPEIDEARQQYLDKRRRVKPDMEKGIYPFRDENGSIRLDRADVEWLLETHSFGGFHGPLVWQGESNWRPDGIDLRGANLTGVNLANLPLTRMLASLRFDEWMKATETQREQAAVHLEGCRLREVHLEGANMRNAHLENAMMHDAHLHSIRLHGAHLEAAELTLAHLEGARLNEVHLGGKYLDEAELAGIRQYIPDFPSELTPAKLSQAYLDMTTNLYETEFVSRDGRSVALADVQWGGANVTVVDWSRIRVFGDEQVTGITANERNNRAVRAYRQVAALLRGQGLSEDADRFSYRAQRLQRKVLWRQGRLGRALGSGLLDLISGYGYRPMRSFIAYALVVLGFAVAYFLLGSAHGQPLTWNESIVVSMTAFHGRGFFAAVFQPGDVQAAVAAVEAFIGLLIEIVFIATFTQRFFAR